LSFEPSTLVGYQDFSAGSGAGGYSHGIAFYNRLGQDAAKAIPGLGVFNVNGLI
jgi:hypothetical protein